MFDAPHSCWVECSGEGRGSVNLFAQCDIFRPRFHAIIKNLHDVLVFIFPYSVLFFELLSFFYQFIEERVILCELR